MREGWLAKQGGRIKTWKNRYVIISGNVLYYFKSPKDKAPAGFLPLENIVVRPLKDKCQFELAPQDGGLLKSVKMESGDKKKTGGLEQVRVRVRDRPNPDPPKEPGPPQVLPL